MSTGTVAVTRGDSEGTWLVALEGDHDVATARELESKTQVVWPLCTDAVIDLSGATFVDSGVIWWLLSAERQLEELGAFTLSVVVGSPESVASRTIALMGVRENLACYATREEALAQAPRHVPGRVARALVSRPAHAVTPRDTAPQSIEAPASDDEAEAPELGEISRAMIRVYTDQFGHTPDHAHTHYSGADAIACFLQGTLTRAERRLTSADEHQRLRDMRMLFQYSAEAEFRVEIEQITGRKVIAFISGIDTREDIASEIFLLEPN